MAKVVVNLSTGMEDGEKVLVAFLVAGAALEQGKQVAMFLTKEAVRVALPGVADAVACEGCPPLARLFEQFAAGARECHAVLRIDAHPQGAAAASLSVSELEVTSYVARGWSNQRIAAERQVSPRTIANQLRAIYHKLGITSRSQLVRATTK